MTNPITHLLWGYTVTERMSDDHHYVILGMFMAIFMDIDGAPISWLPHRGFVHTLPCVLFLCIGAFLYLKQTGHPDRALIHSIVAVNLIVHLILDTVGSNFGIMWGYPVSSLEITLGDHVSISSMYIIKAGLLLIPCGVIWREFRATGRNPLDTYEFLKGRIGTYQTNALILLFLAGVAVYYGWPLLF